jgi:type I restriction enzyme S subunit
MSAIQQLLTDHIDIWTAAEAEKKSGRGRASGNAVSVYGVKKMRELILDLAVRGKLVAQDLNDEPASVLLERIQVEKAHLVDRGEIKNDKSLPVQGRAEMDFAIPKNWAWTKMSSCSKQVTDGEHLTPERTTDASQIALVTAKNVRDGSMDYTDTDFVDRDVAKKCWSRCKPELNDILIVSVGATIGRLTVVDDHRDMVIVRSVTLIKPLLVNVQYLAVALRSPFLQRTMWAGVKQNAQPCLYLSVSNNLPVPIPPLTEQSRIVAKVDELMALCDQLESQHCNAADAHEQLVEHLLGTLTQSKNAGDFAANWQRIAAHFDTLFTTEASIDALKASLLQLAVMGKLVEQDADDEPASELLHQVQVEKARLIADGKIKTPKPLHAITEDEKPFPLPHGWEFVRKLTICEFLNGYAFKSEWFKTSGIKLLRNVNISHGFANWKDTAYISSDHADEFDAFKLNVGDLVLSLDRPIIATGLKFAIIVENDLPCLLLQRVAKISSFCNVVLSGYFSLWLNSSLFIKNIDPGRSNGVPHISTTQLSNMIFALPPIAEQRRIVSKVKELVAVCDRLKSHMIVANKYQKKLADELVQQTLMATMV